MRRLWAGMLLMCAVLVVTRQGSAAESSAPAGVQTTLKRVALFKNGLGYFVHGGQLEAGKTQALVGPFAAPVHGTFWVSAPTSAGLGSVVARQVSVRGETVTARDLGDLLRANVGREVSIWTSEGAAPITGAILSFAPDRPEVTPLGRSYQMGAGGEDRSQIIPWGRGEYVLIQTKVGIIGLSAYNVARVSFPGKEISSTFRTDAPGAELEVSLGSPKAGDWIGVSYLAKGITWAPSYLIDISDPKTARLTAKAEIVNEAEDLCDTHVDLITGYPNLQFADVLSPMAKKTDLAGFLAQLSGQGPQPTAGVMTQRVAANVLGYAGPPGPEYGAPMAGATVEDLFFYPMENVTLRAGDTGYYPLFTVSVPSAQIYQWTIPDYINPSEHYTQQPGRDESREVVWHSIRLTNTSKIPWTTAPAETVKEGQVLGQDTLDYTPAQATGTVKITQAMSVKAEQTEIEVEREREAEKMYGGYFDRVTLQGRLQVANYKAEAICLEIEKTLSGDIKTTSVESKVVTLARGLTRMNPVRKLTWKVDLKPGETKEITYTYKALIRR